MELKIGDIVKRFELSKEIEYEYLIASTTKTQAKTKCGTRFKKELDENTIKPSNICVAQAKKIGYCGHSARYFLIINKGESRKK